MKKLIFLLCLLVCLGARGAGVTPIKNGLLQSNMDGGGNSITNAGFTGNGSGLTNFQDTILSLPSMTKLAFVASGNSITDFRTLGAGYINGWTWAAWITNNGWTPSFFTNTATSGQKDYDILVNYQTQIGQFAPGAGTNGILGFFVDGINEVFAGSNTVQIITNISQICILAHSNNFLIHGIVPTPSLNFSYAQMQVWSSVCQWMHDSQGYFDKITDANYYIAPPWICPSNYVDNITHLQTNMQYDLAIAWLRDEQSGSNWIRDKPVIGFRPSAFVVGNLDNLMIGNHTNANLGGDRNTFVGMFSGYTIGLFPQAVNNFYGGGYCGEFNNYGSNNAVIGALTLQNATNAYLMSGIGFQSMDGQPTGAHDSFLGNGIFNSLTSGFDDVSIGDNSSTALTTGPLNTSVGYGSLTGITTQRYNSVLGAQSATVALGSSNLFLGAQITGVAAEHNVIRIGDGGGNVAIYVPGVGQSVVVSNGIVDGGLNGGSTFNSLVNVTNNLGAGVRIMPPGTGNASEVWSGGVLVASIGTNGGAYFSQSVTNANGLVLGGNLNAITILASGSILPSNGAGGTRSNPFYKFIPGGTGLFQSVNSDSALSPIINIGISTNTILSVGTNWVGVMWSNVVAGIAFQVTNVFTISQTGNVGAAGTITATNGFIGSGSAITNPIVATSISSSLAAQSETVIVTATGTIQTLPTAVGCPGRIYTIKFTASGTLTIATTSSQNIDAATTKTLSTQYDCVDVISDGAQWWLIREYGTGLTL